MKSYEKFLFYSTDNTKIYFQSVVFDIRLLATEIYEFLNAVNF